MITLKAGYWVLIGLLAAAVITVVILAILGVFSGDDVSASSTQTPFPKDKWTEIIDYNFNTDGEKALDSFFQDFQNETEDLNHGNVVYVDSGTSETQGLVTIVNNQMRLKLGARSDTGCVQSTEGTKFPNMCIDSVKFKSRFDLLPTKMVILHAEQIPENQPLWPAFWMTTSDPRTQWPNGGEIDIVETVADVVGNASTLHSGVNCQVKDPARGPAAISEHSNCNQPSGTLAAGTGCGVTQTVSSSKKNGTFACIWTVNESFTKGNISMFYWPYDSKDASFEHGPLGNDPDPDTWNKFQYADFELGDACTPDHFSAMSLVLNIQACGDWAGTVFINPNNPNEKGKDACSQFISSGGIDTEDHKSQWIIDRIRIFANGTAKDLDPFDPDSECTKNGQDPFDQKDSVGTCVQCCSGTTMFDIGTDFRCYTDLAECQAVNASCTSKEGPGCGTPTTCTSPGSNDDIYQSGVCVPCCGGSQAFLTKKTGDSQERYRCYTSLKQCQAAGQCASQSTPDPCGKGHSSN